LTGRRSYSGTAGQKQAVGAIRRPFFLSGAGGEPLQAKEEIWSAQEGKNFLL
jgi:hypothetical protein